MNKERTIITDDDQMYGRLNAEGLSPIRWLDFVGILARVVVAIIGEGGLLSFSIPAGGWDHLPPELVSLNP